MPSGRLLAGAPPPVMPAFMPAVSWPIVAFKAAPVGSLPSRAATAVGPRIFITAGGMPKVFAVPPTRALAPDVAAPPRLPVIRASPTDLPVMAALRPLLAAPVTAFEAMLPNVPPPTALLAAEPAVLMTGAAAAPTPPVKPPVRMPFKTLPPWMAEVRPPLTAPAAAPAPILPAVKPISPAAPMPMPPVAKAVRTAGKALSKKDGGSSRRCDATSLPLLSKMSTAGAPRSFLGTIA